MSTETEDAESAVEKKIGEKIPKLDGYPITR